MSSCIGVTPEHTRTGDTHCLSFSSDSSVFAVGTTRGFSMYTADPFVLLCDRSLVGGVKQIALFGQSNVIALVPAERSHRVLLWNDAATPSPCVVARVDLDSNVQAVRLHRRCIVAASRSLVHLFDASLRRIASFEAESASTRAMAMSSIDPAPNFSVHFACAGPTVGSVLLVTFFDTAAAQQQQQQQQSQQHHSTHRGGGGVSFAPAPTSAAASGTSSLPIGVRLGNAYHQTLTAPHTTQLATLAMTQDGAFVVSASIQGTALKLVEFRTGVVLRQFNRGVLSNTIHSVAFNSKGTLVAVVSETGTVHMYSLSNGVDNVRAANPKSVFTRVAQTLGDAGTVGTGSTAASNLMRNYVSYARGDFAFATFSLASIDMVDGEPTQKLFRASLVALRPGLDPESRATVYVAQGDSGRLVKFKVDATERGQAAHAEAEGSTSSRCVLVATSRFPEVPLL